MKFIHTIILTIIIIFPLQHNSAKSQTYNLPDSNFVFIKGGTFVVGSSSGDIDEINKKRVWINSFKISKFETTNKDFTLFLNSLSDTLKIHNYINLKGTWKDIKCRIYKDNGKYKVKKGYENHPVVFVSWIGAVEYCKFSSSRLPTEYEWEYAAKGGKKGCKIYYKSKYKNKCYKFSGSNNINEVAWYDKNSENKIHAVGLKKPNRKGLYDMSGNVSEWCADKFDAKAYKNAKRINPVGDANTRFRAHRGGSWTNSKNILRLTNRRASNLKTKNSTIGFRVIKKE